MILHCILGGLKDIPEYHKIEVESKPKTYKVTKGSVYRSVISKTDIGKVCTQELGRFPTIFDTDKAHMIETWNKYVEITKESTTINYNSRMEKLNNSIMTMDDCD